MIKKACLGLAVFFWSNIVFAQSTSIPNTIADEGVSDAKAHMDSDYTGSQLDINDYNQKQTDLAARQQAILALATQNPPLQSAVDLCNSNAALYCPGWGTSPSEITSPSQVNWDEVALLKEQGTNWADITATMAGINWTAVNQVNGINWAAVNQAGINWNAWPQFEAQGQNWQDFIGSGGQ